MTKDLNKKLVLGILFIFPLLVYLFFASGKNNFAKLPILTEKVNELPKGYLGGKIKLKNKITILGYWGGDLKNKKADFIFIISPEQLLMIQTLFSDFEI